MESRLIQVLGVADDFDEFGGASAELVAWELGIDHELVRDAWDKAIRDGLVVAAPQDEIFGEEMWRLTEEGRLLLEVEAPAPQPPTRFVALPAVRRARASPSVSSPAPLRLTH